MSERFEKPAMGWLPDYPDFRDYTAQTETISALMKKARVSGSGKKAKLPATCDFRSWCSPVEDQGKLGSCTAQAGVGMVEYFERRAFGRHVEASRLFLYKVTRNLLHWTGDTGAFLRTAMGALVLFGVPPEEYWPYETEGFDKEPPAFCYAFAQNYQAIQYYRLDPPGVSHAELLTQIRTKLAAGLPSMFGFSVYSSIDQGRQNGENPIPGNRREAPGRTRRDGSRLRRQNEDPQCKSGRSGDNRGDPHPKFLGRQVGRERIRLAPL